LKCIPSRAEHLLVHFRWGYAIGHHLLFFVSLVRLSTGPCEHEHTSIAVNSGKRHRDPVCGCEDRHFPGQRFWMQNHPGP
jgi:hypothetical protein